MSKTKKFRGRRYRNGATRKHRGSRGGDLVNAVKQGFKQGIRNAPHAVYKSLRSSGSTYGSPGNSIAGLAGNNIANILRANENALRSGLSNLRQGLKIRIPSPPSFGRQTSLPSFTPITPITPRPSSPKILSGNAPFFRPNIVRPVAIRATNGFQLA